MNIQKQPLISIITISYNAVETIERTILSVLNQTDVYLEYIVIDGGSTDGTIDIIRKYENQLAYWVSEPDKGIYDAMNKGICQAKGDFVGIINSDDWYAPKTLSIITEQIQLHKDVDVFCGDLCVHYPNGKTTIVSSRPQRIQYTMSINHPTCFVRSNIYKKKKFSVSYRLASDYDFLLWCSLHHCKIQNVAVILAHFTVGGATYQSNYKGTVEAFHIWCEQLDVVRATVYFIRDMSISYLTKLKQLFSKK